MESGFGLYEMRKSPFPSRALFEWRMAADGVWKATSVTAMLKLHREGWLALRTRLEAGEEVTVETDGVTRVFRRISQERPN